MSLKPYEDYAGSGRLWFGRVPSHWKVLPNRALFSEVNERNCPDEQLLSVTINKGVIKQRDLFAGSSKKDSSNENKSNYKLVKPRDIAYNKMRAWQGAIGVSGHQGIVSPAYIVVRLRGEQEPDYYHYLFRTPAFAKEAERWSYGITSDQWSLRGEHFKQIYCPVPPQDEQRDVVRYLRYVDGRFDRLIRLKQQVIKFLNEQKQAIIQHAVTLGLDPNVPLKPSGVDWLGDVPEHWRVLRLRHLIKGIDQGVSPLAEAGLAEGDSWGVLKSGCVNGGLFRPLEHKRLPSDFVIDPAHVVREGDVLVSRACGSPKLVGSVGIVTHSPYRVILSDKTFRLKIRNPTLSRFLVTAMNTVYFRQQVEMAISGAEGLANNLPVTSLKDFWLAVPPPTEAESIVVHLEEETEGLRSAISRMESEVILLREYRIRLIADVVTGKLDVCDIEVPALDEVDEFETLDSADDIETNALDETEELAYADD